MAVISVAEERPDTQDAHFGADFQIIRRFNVHTDNVQDGPLTVTRANGIPRYGEAYSTPTEFHEFIRVTDVDPVRAAPGSSSWHVTVTYRSPQRREPGATGEAGLGTTTFTPGQENNPLIELPELRMTDENYQTVMPWVYDTADGTRKPVRNTAGQIFTDPPPMRDLGRLIMTFTKNFPLVSGASLLATAVVYKLSVNSDTFFGFSAGMCRLDSLTLERQTKQLTNGLQIPFLKATYSVKITDDWDLLILNSGDYWIEPSLSPANVRKHKFMTDEGHPRKGLLALDGGKLADDAVPLFIRTRPYPRLPFATLGLPQSFLEVR